MRFIPIRCVREGTKLGKPIYNSSGELLLSQGVILAESYIKKLASLGYSGVYVEDDISKDIEVVNAISDSLKTKAVKNVKNIFLNAENNKAANTAQLELAKNIIDNILEELLEKKGIINLVDLKIFDDYTFFHCVNVAVLSIILGIAYGFNKDKLYKLGVSAIFHDIGKVFVDKEILNKNGKLTDEEFTHMKSHAYLGYDYLRKLYFIPTESYAAVLQHHEKYDGTGYPNNLKGDEISLYARIIAVADVYDALTSDRPYRKAILPSEAVEYIMSGGGSFFDPKIVELFVLKIAPYPVGTVVQLSNGDVGIVVENFERFSMRPNIKILKQKDKPVKPFVLELRKGDRDTINVTIVDIVDL